MARRFDRAGLLLIAALLVAWALRLHHSATLADTILYDEAAYALDALSLIEQPRLTAYFPANFGRESLWMYALAPLLAIVTDPFALRLAAAFTGVLTVAAVYRLGAGLLGRAGGMWAAWALAVLYWSVHLNHVGFRANLLPLVGALALAAILHSVKDGRRWWLAGIFTGLLLWTYTAGQLWFVLLAAGLLLYGFRRRGAWLALVIAVIVALPPALSIFASGAVRAGDVAVTDAAAVLDNALLWLRAPLMQGDLYPVHNLPGRPVWDVPFFILSAAGIVGLIRYSKPRAAALIVPVVVTVSLVPSLLSVDAPHMLRAIGAVVPLTLLAGAGALWLSRTLPRGAVVSLALMLISAAITWHDFDRATVEIMQFTAQERAVLSAAEKLTAVNVTEPVYFLPYPQGHPVVAFAGQQHGLTVRGFDAGYCTVYRDGGAYYVAVSDAGFVAAQMGRYGDVTAHHTADDFVIWHVTPSADLLRGWDDAAEIGTLRLQTLTEIPATVSHTETVTFALRGRDNAVLNMALQTIRYTDDGATLAGNDDRRLCEPYPVTMWQTDEIIVQTYELRTGEATGELSVEVAVYESETMTQRTTANDAARLTVGTVTAE